ncbi:Hypothetical protein FKW44_005442, partial [Caligus rogercresseyi]
EPSKRRAIVRTGGLSVQKGLAHRDVFKISVKIQSRGLHCKSAESDLRLQIAR